MSHRISHRLLLLAAVSIALISASCSLRRDPFIKYTPFGLIAIGSEKYTPKISGTELGDSVAWLAADDMEGRMTGSPGAKKAADFLAERMRRAGLQPAGDPGSFFQQFPFKETHDRNVIGLLPPTGGADDYVMIGAHYDHIGHGEGGGSLADKSEVGQIHNGADDNASGTSTVLELADYFARNPAKEGRRGLIFACWSGEEEGVIGSTYFAQHPTVPLEKIAAYLNFDMVGHLRDNKLVLQGVGSSPDWRRCIEKRNVAAGFDLVLQDDPYQPTDTTAFYPHGVPVLGFFTGAHEFYNKPSDDAHRINYDGMERITKFAEQLASDLASPTVRLAYAKVEMKTAASGSRRGRVSTGTIPDYATADIKGMKLSGVRAGGPADKAGLKAGDVIIRMAGQPVEDVQGYSDLLGTLSADVQIEVVINRDGQEMTMTMTPVAAQPQG